MTDEPLPDGASTAPRNRIDIFVDGVAQPLLSMTPPLSFELDTSRMDDGPHIMRIEAYDAQGVRGTPHESISASATVPASPSRAFGSTMSSTERSRSS